MNILTGMILGILQGILEWLPVSSEGILTLVSINFLKISTLEAIKFSIWLHLGTFFAAIFYFRKDIIGLIKHLPVYFKNFRFADEKTKLINFLIISTLLTGLIGFPIFLFVLDFFSSISAKIMTFLIGLLLIMTGFIQKKSKEGFKDINALKKEDGIILGFLQGFSILPGISRSGVTTSGLLFRRFNSETALKLSFLMSIPAIFVAEIGLGILEGVEFSLASVSSVLMSFLFGLLSIGLLLKIARKVEFWKFCIILGLISIISILI